MFLAKLKCTNLYNCAHLTVQCMQSVVYNYFMVFVLQVQDVQCLLFLHPNAAVTNPIFGSRWKISYQPKTRPTTLQCSSGQISFMVSQFLPISHGILQPTCDVTGVMFLWAFAGFANLVQLHIPVYQVPLSSRLVPINIKETAQTCKSVIKSSSPYDLCSQLTIIPYRMR